MGFENCSICGKLFDKKKSNLCPACDAIEAANFKKISDFLQAYEETKNKTFSLNMLSSITGVKIQDIERLYRSNKLKNYRSLIGVDCKLCGTIFKPTIHSGVFCKKCTTKVEKVIKELKDSEIINQKNIIIEKPKEVIKAKEEAAPSSGMHVKDDPKQRFGFKKN